MTGTGPGSSSNCAHELRMRSEGFSAGEEAPESG
jgi:hypothetical protein